MGNLGFMIHFLPLLIAVMSAVLMVVSRLLTNRYCKKHGCEIIMARSVTGFIPAWVSSVYLIGLGILFACVVWSLFSIGWRAALFVLLLYFVTGLVHSRISDLKLMLRFNQQGKDQQRDN